MFEDLRRNYRLHNLLCRYDGGNKHFMARDSMQFLPNDLRNELRGQKS